MCRFILAEMRSRSYSGNGTDSSIFLLPDKRHQDEPLRERLRSLPGRDALVTPSSGVTMARTAAFFFLSGAVIVPASLAAPHSSTVDERLLAAAAGGAALMGVVLLLA